MNQKINNSKLYRLLPFRFKKFSNDEVFISNEVGEFIFISKDDFKKLVTYQLDFQSGTFLNLKSKQILTDTEIEPVIEMLATKYRTKKSFLNNFTALHMVVPTLRCNSNCKYCQVSRKDINAKHSDMDKITAKKTVDLIFKSPSPVIKIEFQGGEPLLNFKIIRYIIERAEWLNIFKRKYLEFVICTNLTLVTEEMLKYLKEHHVYISTSLDGPKDLHNTNRPLQSTENSYDIVIEKINLCRKYLGEDAVSALMTASRYSLGRFKEIVDEYLKQDFNSIFLRSLNPYGFAKRDREGLGYEIDEFIDDYKEVLDYIVDINLKGKFFVESFASLLLTRILTPFSTGFVDMQSPAGVGISGVVYNYDGNVYVSDEARMLASMGDNKFLMGNVHKQSYQELFNSEFLHSLIKSACLESLPECDYCAYQSFCGADPVRNYSEQGDIVGNRAISEVCKKNKKIMRYLLELIKKDDTNINNVFWSWITRRPIEIGTKYI